MKFRLEKISHFDFFERLEKYKGEAMTLLTDESIELQELIIRTDNVINDTVTLISEHIKPESDKILSMLSVSQITILDRYYSSSYAYERKPEFKKVITRVDSFQSSLESTIDYLSTIDSLVDPNYENKIETISDKNDFILSKLNKLFGDRQYSISTLLKLNDIKQRDREGREIAEDLSRRGYVILNERYGDLDYVKISIKGASYIERKEKQKARNPTPTQLDHKIDNIIEHLTKLGLGQEIVFNEIEELKDLQHKLSKKTWSQLLKGKLIDLAFDKLIDIETVTSIYEYLTNSNLKLLK